MKNGNVPPRRNPAPIDYADKSYLQHPDYQPSPERRHAEKLLRAKMFLGERWCLHPARRLQYRPAEAPVPNLAGKRVSALY